MSTPPSQTNLPDEQTIAAASELKIQDESGTQVTFGKLFSEQKTIIVFVREWHYSKPGMLC